MWFSSGTPVSSTNKTRGGSRGGAHPARAPPKIGKNMIFWRKIVFFHTKYPKYFRASLCSAQFFNVPPPPPQFEILDPPQKTDHHDITEILLKVTLNIIKQAKLSKLNSKIDPFLPYHNFNFQPCPMGPSQCHSFSVVFLMNTKKS